MFSGGARTRKRQRIKLAPTTMPEREVRKIAAELLRPLNQGLISVGSAVNFGEYVSNEYRPTVLPLLASSTQQSYTGVIRRYLIPAFGDLCLRDLTPSTLQRYFSGMAGQNIGHTVIVKLRDALSSVLRSAVPEFLVKNPLDGLRLPRDRRGRRAKPFISPDQFKRHGATGARALRDNALRKRLDRPSSERTDRPKVALYPS